jgi:tRNA A-37 threonylcarbamoyl transferase component Bud32
MPLESQMLNNRYKLLAQIAAGGMALVYKAQDTLLNRIVAIKILRESFAEDPAFQKRFTREAQSAANLSHPNIVAVYDFGRDGDRQYIVMENVEGRDLKSVIRAEGPLPLPRALNIAEQICAGVGAAHRTGIVHCDVKPQNVILTTEGQAKVTDFGIARAFMAAAPGGYTESVWGTPHYFSPEQAAGEQPTPASDVYSIGVILFEMLTGRLPFEGENQQQLALAHLRDAPPPITQINPAIPVELEQIVNQVLSKEPAQRYRNADQFGRVLLEYQRSSEQATSLQPAVLAPSGLAAAPYSRAAQPEVEEPEPAGFDWPAWVLAAIALAAVIGLIALWMMVYRVYTTAPRIPPTPTSAPPTATVTNAGQQTSVPDLINRDRKEVEQLLAQAGLQLAVKEERFDDKQPAGIALEQSPPQGTSAKRGDVVQVVFSKGPKVSNVPGVIGSLYNDEIKAGLESYGWKVVLEPQWSTDPISKVIGQIPAPGIPLTTGLVITLQVSSGSVVPIDANLGNLITLESADLPRDTLRPGETLELTLHWKARVNNIEQPYKVFVHLIGPTGKLATQVDREPQDGRAPTTTWTTGAVVQDRYTFEIPRDAPRGAYQLRVGLYPANNPATRLPVVDPGKISADNNSLLIKTLTIGP